MATAEYQWELKFKEQAYWNSRNAENGYVLFDTYPISWHVKEVTGQIGKSLCIMLDLRSKMGVRRNTKQLRKVRVLNSIQNVQKSVNWLRNLLQQLWAYFFYCIILWSKKVSLSDTASFGSFFKIFFSVNIFIF